MRVLVIGAGLAGLAASERLLDAGAQVVVVDAFPRPGGRTANFDVTQPVAGLIAGDVIEHGLHAWFQHYRALFGLMARAGVAKPAFAGRGVHLFERDSGHCVLEGGPFVWLLNALRLPPTMRGDRGAALRAFGRLLQWLDSALAEPARTDAESAASLFARAGVPVEALNTVFAPCLYSLTSLRLAELSALEMLRWMAAIIPDPRIRCLEGGGSTAMCEPIAAYLRERSADIRLGVELQRLSLGKDGRAQVVLTQAPDRTGLRHILVRDFAPAQPPSAAGFDAIVCTLPWEKLLAVSEHDPALMAQPAWANLRALRNVHPLTIRLWFERPIAGAEEHYILSRGTLFDVVRPTREPRRQAGIHLVDALVENVDTHLPELAYEREQYLTPGPLQASIIARVLRDLERMYPGQIRDNRVLRSFLHTREGIVACRPGVWEKRAPQHVGIANLVLAGDWTQHGWGVCMEGAVRSGELAAQALLSGRAPEQTRPPTYAHLAHSMRTLFDRA
jgi:15-cis-phytoene desaturase